MNKNSFPFFSDMASIHKIHLLRNKLINQENISLVYDLINEWLKQEFEIKRFDIIQINKDISRNYTIFPHIIKEDLKNPYFEYTIPYDANKSFRLLFYFEDEHKSHKLKKDTFFIEFLFYEILPIIELLKTKSELQVALSVDTLTGFYNRNYLIEHLKKVLPLSKREKRNLGFLLVEVDHFKAVIEEFNYDIGNKVLLQLSKVLKESFRESDIIIRLDRDQFLVFLSKIQASDNLTLICEKLIDSFATKGVSVCDKSNQELKKTISIGTLFYSYEKEDDINEIFRKLDVSLCEAQNTGRGKFMAYNDNLNSIDLF